MKVLYCEQCDEMITKDSFGISFEDLYFCSDTCLHDYVDMMREPISDRDFELYGEEPDEEGRKPTMEQRKTKKCAWCGTKEHLDIASIFPPERYFCSYDCLHKWEWFNRNGQNWLKTKETSNGEKKN